MSQTLLSAIAPVDPDFQKLFKASPALVLVLWPDLRVATASDAYLKTIDKTLEEIRGRGLFEIFPDDGKDSTSGLAALRASMGRVRERKATDTVTILGRDRTKYWTAVNAPILDDAGEILYIVLRAEDVTERVRERELFFNHSLDLLAIAGTDGYFKLVNPAFERVLGYTAEELYAQPMVEFMHPEDVEKTRKGISILASGSPRVTSVNRYRCKDGSYKHLSWNTTPVGTVLYTLGRDITEQVRTEERIRLLNDELAQRNEDLEHKVQERIADLRNSEAQVQQLQKMDAIGRLAGGVAHDFNNMLGAITMYCDLLADDVANPELLKGHIQDIKQVAERGAALTKQLLVFSRKQVIQPETIRLNPLIERMEKMLARIIGEHNSIVMNLHRDLSPVRVDPSQMEQVLMNLVVNARDAMKDGGKITIETANTHLDETFTSTHLTVEPGDYVRLSVSDTGCGMDAETQAKIFEPFFTTKPLGKGTGLGLTTSYGIIKQSGGTIWVYSELGKGTVFKIYLPVVDRQPSAPTADTPKAPTDFGLRTILLVEDDQVLREGFSRMLRRMGFEVLTAGDGDEALRVLDDCKVPLHLMVTDVIMPGMNGFELAKTVHTRKRDLPVLYMSGYTSDALESSRGELTEEMDYIQKPFNTSMLVTKIREILSR